MSILPGPGSPADRDFLGLRWSAWMPLMAAHPLALAQLPSAPGLYRLRAAATQHDFLMFEWACDGVRQAIERLSRQVHLPVQPYDDVNSPALALWQYRVSTATGFEVSGSAVAPAADERARVACALVTFGFTAQSVPPRG